MVPTEKSSISAPICVFAVRSPETNPTATRGAIVTDRSWHVQMEGSFLAYEWPTCTETLSDRGIFMGNIRPRSMRNFHALCR